MKTSLFISKGITVPSLARRMFDWLSLGVCQYVSENHPVCENALASSDFLIDDRHATTTGFVFRESSYSALLRPRVESPTVVKIALAHKNHKNDYFRAGFCRNIR